MPALFVALTPIGGESGWPIWSFLAAGQRQSHDKLASLANPVTPHANRTAVERRYILHHRNSDSESAALSSTYEICLHEEIENVGQYFGRNSDTIVFNFYLNAPALG